jgi:carbon monoxide dehydrogenase subunit G
MEFDNSFDVPLSPPEAWTVLMDIRRIAPCMPGAALTEIIDPQNFRGKISVRLGPVALAFAGRVQFENVDDANHSALVRAQGSDDKGRGSANATATFRIEPSGGGSRVLIHTDLMLSGAVAQYGRGVGMIQATASQIIGQFAANLRTQLEQQPPAVEIPAVASPPTAPTAPPITQSNPPPNPPPKAQASPPRNVVPSAVAAAPPPPKAQPLPPAAKPISGLSLIARVIWQRVADLFGGRRG